MLADRRHRRRRQGRQGDRRRRRAGRRCSHDVDALGVAFDPKDGSVYFGLGTHELRQRATCIDKDGKAALRPRRTSAARSIRVSPDFKTREIVATGIRFPVGLRFNRARRPVRHRPGRGDLAAQRQPVRRAAAHPEGPALRLPAAAPEAPAERDRRAEHVRLRPAAPVDVRVLLQRAGEGRPDVRPEGVGRRRDRDRRLARQALPHAAGEDRRRLRRPEPAARVPATC